MKQHNPNFYDPKEIYQRVFKYIHNIFFLYIFLTQRKNLFKDNTYLEKVLFHEITN